MRTWLHQGVQDVAADIPDTDIGAYLQFASNGDSELPRYLCHTLSADCTGKAVSLQLSLECSHTAVFGSLLLLFQHAKQIPANSVGDVPVYRRCF